MTFTCFAFLGVSASGNLSKTFIGVKKLYYCVHLLSFIMTLYHFLNDDSFMVSYDET